MYYFCYQMGDLITLEEWRAVSRRHSHFFLSRSKTTTLVGYDFAAGFLFSYILALPTPQHGKPGPGRHVWASGKNSRGLPRLVKAGLASSGLPAGGKGALDEDTTQVRDTQRDRLLAAAVYDRGSWRL